MRPQTNGGVKDEKRELGRIQKTRDVIGPGGFVVLIFFAIGLITCLIAGSYLVYRLWELVL